MADDRIPQAQSEVLEPGGKRFNTSWFRFFAALDGILARIADSDALALLKANNLSDLASASTAFANIKQAASGATTGVVRQEQQGHWTHTIAEVEDVTSRFLCRAQFSGTIDSTYTDCQSGSCTVRWSINGVAVGTQTNTVSTTAQIRTHTSANTFSGGDIITYTITSNSSCLEALLQANITYNLVA